MSSSSYYSFSSSFSNIGTHPNVYHRKVIFEKVIKNHCPSDDEKIPLPKEDSVLLWTNNVASGQVWYNIPDVHYSPSDYIHETKPHLIMPEPVRKAVTKRPPELIKKFGNSYSKSFGSKNRNRQFSRKAF